MRKILWLAVAAVGLGLTAPGVGRAGLITFDEPVVAGVANPAVGLLQYGAPLTTYYAPEGVLFSGPSTGSGGVIVSDPGDADYFGALPHSGNNVLAFNRNASIGGSTYPMLGGSSGMATDPETITFDSTQSQVSIFAAGGLQTHIFTIQGFDANGMTIDGATETLSTLDWSQLSIAASGIKSVQLTETGYVGDSWVYDDLSFTPDGGGVVSTNGGPSGAPEPCSLVLLSLGGFGLAGWRLRQRVRAV